MKLIDLDFHGNSPRVVKHAAALMLAYGILVILNATVLQVLSGWVDAGDYPRAIVRLLGMLLLASGLLQGRRWAWWITVILFSLWAFTGLIAMGLALVMGRGAEVTWPLNLIVTSAIGFGIMIWVLVLLLQPAARNAIPRA